MYLPHVVHVTDASVYLIGPRSQPQNESERGTEPSLTCNNKGDPSPMSSGQFYLNPRRVMTDPYTGETVICAGHDGTQHGHRLATQYLDPCEDCGDQVWVCAECDRCVSCCSCGNYHSIDCPWLL